MGSKNSSGWVLLHKFRQNPAIRTALSPVMNLKKKITKACYINSDDSRKLAALKNSHMGERCFVIGNGPSLCGEDLDLVAREQTFACNRIYAIFDKTEWRPTYYMCMDAMVYATGVLEHFDTLSSSTKFIASFCYKYGVPDDKSVIKVIKPNNVISHVERFKKTKASEDVSKGFSDAVSVIQSIIELAIYMGYKDIILLGVDHNFPLMKDSRGNIIINKDIEGHVAGGGSANSRLDLCYIDALTNCYEFLNGFAKEHGVRIRNATPRTKLDVYEKVSLIDVLNEECEL